MKLAALFDIHGNVPALEAVLDEVEAAGVDEVVIGGDVALGPMPSQALDRLTAFQADTGKPVSFIQGNCDREMVAMRRGINTGALQEAFLPIFRWAADQITVEQEEAMSRWPLICRRSVPRIGNILFCHAVPQNDMDIFTRLTAEEKLLPIFEGLGVDMVVCGHTHMQFDRMVGDVRVVNAGSVGMPFGEPGAHWLLLGPGVEHRRTSYDREAAAELIRRSGHPQAEQMVEKNILNAPSEAEMLSLYSKYELA